MKRKSLYRLRFDVLERDGFTCQYCGAKAPDAQLEVDHIVPVVRGGTNDPDNLRTACVGCNRGKGDKLLESLVRFEDLLPNLKRSRGGERNGTSGRVRTIIKLRAKQDEWLAERAKRNERNKSAELRVLIREKMQQEAKAA